MDVLLSFKHLDQDHRPLVHIWLSQPHVAQWFYGSGLQSTLKGIEAFLHGSDRAQYWLVFDRDHPFAMFITSVVNQSNHPLASFCSKEGISLTLDMLIGDQQYLGKGLASGTIQQFLSSQFPHVSEVLIDPEVTNQRAIRVYQKAGFQIIGECIPSYSTMLHCIMRLSTKNIPSVN